MLKMYPRSKKFLCNDCGEEFSRKYNLGRHISRLHISGSKGLTSRHVRHNSRIICPVCENVCVTFNYLEKHLQSEHNVELNVSKMKFPSEDEFWKWKEREESSSISMFTRNKTHVKKNGDKVTRFTCNRSGVYRRKGTGQRMARSKGTCKIGFCCTARILVTFEAGGSVNVEYHSTHIGHEHQFCFLPLPSSQKQLIADKLKEGADLDQILDEVRNEITASSALEKKHFLNKKTLFNIMKKYSISDVKKRPKRNNLNADTLLSECKEMAHNPIIMNKQKGEAHDILDTDATMIIIMNDVQIEIMKKFAPEKICVDNSTSKKSSLQLIAVVVIDEFGEEFPCCFCICDQINEITLSVLFDVIKSYTGPISTNVFMSEDNRCYYETWEKIMSKPDNILMCKWHVDEDWKRNLKLINDKRAKCEVYSRLRPLLEETDQNAFFSSFNSILGELKQAGHFDFHNYFKSKYCYRLEAWASCYRPKEFLNHIMALEAFHRVLNHIHAKGMKNTNIDILLHLFFKVIREKVFNRLMYLEDNTGTSYTEKLYKRHRRRNEVKETDIVEFSGYQWKVKCDREENVVYNIKVETATCECKRKCTSCDACVHMFSCTCNDYLILHNLCKHIHAVRMLQKQSIPETTVVEESVPHDVTNSLIFEDVCQVLEVGNSMTIQGKDNLINKLNQCLSLINETECENITAEMEETMNTNVDNILAILYGNFKVTVESMY